MRILAQPVFLLVFAVFLHGIGYALFRKLQHGIATLEAFFQRGTILSAYVGFTYNDGQPANDDVALVHDLWWHSFLWLKPTKKMVLWGATLLLIVLITVNTVWNTTYLNWDDETCCANSVGAWYADLVNRTALESGKLKKAFYDKKYVIAGWSIFSLMLAVLTDIYPAVINRMLLPMIKIPLTYSIFYQMINNLFMQQTKKRFSA